MYLNNRTGAPARTSGVETIGSGPPSNGANLRADTQGIILSGVHSWERHGFGGLIFKSLVPIALRPLIWHVTQWLRHGGINRACICGNSHTDYLREHLGDGRADEMDLSYAEDLMPRGPAGCVRDAGIGQPADQFVVIEGAVVPHVDLAALLEAHKESGAGLTVVAGTARGLGRIDAVQKPMGIYVFSSRILKKIPASGYQDIKEKLIPDLYRMGERVMAFEVTEDAALRVGNAASYLGTNMYEVQRIVRIGALGEDYVQIADAWVHASARVDPTARFVGPALVGAGSRIGPGSLVVGPTSIGSDCRIEAGAVVSRAVVWEGCTIGRHALLDRSILTTEADVPAGEVLRNAARFTRGRSLCRPLDRFVRYFRATGREDGVMARGLKRSTAFAYHPGRPRAISNTVESLPVARPHLGTACLHISSDIEAGSSC